MKGIATVLIVLFVLICLGALLVTAVHKAHRRARIVHCAGNLAQLWKMENVYLSVHGGSMKLYPTEIGGAFWMKLNTVEPPLIEDSAIDIFFCPVLEEYGGKGQTNYLGPRADIHTLLDDEYIGGDRPGHHGADGGNMVLKSSDVLELPMTEFLKAAARCRP